MIHFLTATVLATLTVILMFVVGRNIYTAIKFIKLYYHRSHYIDYVVSLSCKDGYFKKTYSYSKNILPLAVCAKLVSRLKKRYGKINSLNIAIECYDEAICESQGAELMDYFNQLNKEHAEANKPY